MRIYKNGHLAKSYRHDIIQISLDGHVKPKNCIELKKCFFFSEDGNLC